MLRRGRKRGDWLTVPTQPHLGNTRGEGITTPRTWAHFVRRCSPLPPQFSLLRRREQPNYQGSDVSKSVPEPSVPTFSRVPSFSLHRAEVQASPAVKVFEESDRTLAGHLKAIKVHLKKKAQCVANSALVRGDDRMSSQMRIPQAVHPRDFIQENSRQPQTKAWVISPSPAPPHTTTAAAAFISRWLFADLCRLACPKEGGGLPNSSLVRSRHCFGSQSWRVGLDPSQLRPWALKARRHAVTHADGRSSPLKPASEQSPGSPSLHLPQKSTERKGWNPRFDAV